MARAAKKIGGTIFFSLGSRYTTGEPASPFNDKRRQLKLVQLLKPKNAYIAHANGGGGLHAHHSLGQRNKERSRSVDGLAGLGLDGLDLSVHEPGGIVGGVELSKRSPNGGLVGQGVALDHRALGQWDNVDGRCSLKVSLAISFNTKIHRAYQWC
jgi:hypothetical protein